VVAIGPTKVAWRENEKAKTTGNHGGRRYSGSRHNGGNQERAQSVSSISAEAMRASTSRAFERKDSTALQRCGISIGPPSAAGQTRLIGGTQD
jgi:hypothetical protein